VGKVEKKDGDLGTRGPEREGMTRRPWGGKGEFVRIRGEMGRGGW